MRSPFLVACLMAASVAPNSVAQQREKPKSALRPLAAERLWAVLQAPTEIAAEKVPLDELLARVSERHGVLIRLDEQGLKAAGVASNIPVSVLVRDVPLVEALQRVVGELKLELSAQDGCLLVAGPAPERIVNAEPRSSIWNQLQVQSNREALEAMEANRRIASEREWEGIAGRFPDLLPQFREILQVERSFIQRTCEPSDEQWQRISQEDVECIRSAVKGYIGKASAHSGRAGRMEDRMVDASPRRFAQRAVAARLAKHLSPEQAARYRAECQKRMEGERQFAVVSVTAMIDRLLSLSSDQRRKVANSLLANWDDAWQPSPEMYLHAEGCRPPLSDWLVAPLLTSTQKFIWQGAPVARFELGASSPRLVVMPAGEPDEAPPIP